MQQLSIAIHVLNISSEIARGQFIQYYLWVDMAVTEISAGRKSNRYKQGGSPFNVNTEQILLIMKSITLPGTYRRSE